MAGFPPLLGAGVAGTICTASYCVCSRCPTSYKLYLFGLCVHDKASIIKGTWGGESTIMTYPLSSSYQYYTIHTITATTLQKSPHFMYTL